jgi:hypothetical protein
MLRALILVVVTLRVRPLGLETMPDYATALTVVANAGVAP